METINYRSLNIELHDIVVAVTSEPDYEMSRNILLEYKGEYVIIEGSHCSCYNFDETEWYVTKYTREELKKLANSLYNQENKFWELVREQIK